MSKREFSNLPAHVGIIMDGNGRWARRRAMPRFLGHRQGVGALKKAVRYASNLGIGTLTVYAFSTENWQRPQEEVSFLLDLMRKTFIQEIEELVAENVKIVLIGDRTSLTPQVLDVWMQAEEKTKANTGMTFNVAFNYGARQEIVAAMRSVAKKVAEGELAWEEIGEQDITNSLYTNHCPDPDLIIRTGGELRLSNFLLWQAAYSEIYVTDVLWPDFTEEDFAAALRAFQKRERRFGQVPAKEQKK